MPGTAPSRFDTAEKSYRLDETLATSLVRPRGWHLTERHVRSAAHRCRQASSTSGSTWPTVPEGRWNVGAVPTSTCPSWRAISRRGCGTMSSSPLRMRSGSRRARSGPRCSSRRSSPPSRWTRSSGSCASHSAGLNVGRWDYIFSVIKKFRNLPGFVLPDRAQVTMTVPFMRAYTELLVKTCHHRAAHAIGGMAAFVPNRGDPEVTDQAIAKVREDKSREAGDGCDGTWVAHPDLVPVALEVFDAVLGDRPNQIDRKRPDVETDSAALVRRRGSRWDGHRCRSPDQRRRRHPLPGILAIRDRGRGDLQPHGGRRHRRDLPVAGVAMGPRRRFHRGRRR